MCVSEPIRAKVEGIDPCTLAPEMLKNFKAVQLPTVLGIVPPMFVPAKFRRVRAERMVKAVGIDPVTEYPCKSTATTLPDGSHEIPLQRHGLVDETPFAEHCHEFVVCTFVAATNPHRAVS